jgi:hypothetical protein
MLPLVNGSVPANVRSNSGPRIELADSFILSNDPVGTRWEGTPARCLFHRRQIGQSVHFSRLLDARLVANGAAKRK